MIAATKVSRPVAQSAPDVLEEVLPAPVELAALAIYELNKATHKHRDSTSVKHLRNFLNRLNMSGIFELTAKTIRFVNVIRLIIARMAVQQLNLRSQQLFGRTFLNACRALCPHNRGKCKFVRSLLLFGALSRTSTGPYAPATVESVSLFEVDCSSAHLPNVHRVLAPATVEM